MKVMELPITIFLIMIALMFSGRPALRTEKSVLELFPEFDNLKQDYQDLKQHYQDLKQHYQDLKQHNQDIQAKLAVLPSDIGTTYIRWSRKQCPNNRYTELVYSGYTGGGSHGESGSAAESVCLPQYPDFGKTSGSGYGRIYGAEFDSNSFASNSKFQDIPCAVCRVKKASSVVMIPGKNRCFTGWNMEYHGYLSSNDNNANSAGSFTCIDIQPEYVKGGSAWNGQGKHFYDVIAKCGTLHCPPYKHNYPLTCVVCSK